MNNRLFAIGDVHGCLTALRNLVEAIQLSELDTVVMLGDYVGKGEESCGVIDFLISLESRCRLITLLGNHDLLMLSALEGTLSVKTWLLFGGDVILKSYGQAQQIDEIPVKHRDFLRACKLFYETESHLFMHACYCPDLELKATDETTLLWTNVHDELPRPHFSQKTAIVGHTSQTCGSVMDAGHLLCIDTNCCDGGWLTALEVEASEITQVDCQGRLRSVA